MGGSEMYVEKLPAWAKDINATAKNVCIAKEEADWKKPSIYHVPKFAKFHNQNAFTPQVLSFGPFHHAAEHLVVNEFHKHRALAHFLHQSEKESELFISKLRCILDQLLDSYQGLDKKWKDNTDEFLKMMLLDGCFLIEILRLKDFSEGKYATNDPVFSLKMMTLRKPYIKRDMLLLENQLPLLVLQALLEVEGTRPANDQYINDLVLKFCNENSEAELPKLASHPLELYRMSLLGKAKSNTEQNTTVFVNVRDPIFETEVIDINAVELRESGVRFRRNQSPSLCDIKFDPNTGWLELPVIPVHDGTEHLLLNMIAYEQIHVGVGSEITSYVAFMDSLIDTKDDVKLLQKKKIISNALGSHEAIAQLFNSLAKEAAFDPDTDVLYKVRTDLSKYYEKSANKWLANLRHEYLHSPWKVISIIAAVVAILLTVIQTVYSMLQVHLPK